MLRFAVLIAVLAMCQGGEENSMEGGVSEYQKWKMMDEKNDKVMLYHKFQEFVTFKEKLSKMKEMEKKKDIYYEFLKFKAHKEKMMSGKGSEEKEDKRGKEEKEDKWGKEEKEDKNSHEESDEKDGKDHEKKFEMMMEKFHDDKKKQVKALTAAFLGMCKCQNDMGYEMSEMMKSGNKTTGDMQDMFEEEVPDFKGNMTAKAHFLKQLKPEQKHKMFMYGLVKSMCGGAKTFISHVKAFDEKYMKPEQQQQQQH